MKPVKKFFVYKYKLSLSLSLLYLAELFINKLKTKFNEFIWNQINNFMSPFSISLMHGFCGGEVDCDFKDLEALECEL